MAITLRALTAPVLATLLLGAPTGADSIHKTDGTSIDDVTVVEENLTQVIYKAGSNERSVPSEEVLSVAFEKFPREVDEAEGALAQDDIGTALDLFESYVDDQIENPRERRKWAPPYAAWRLVEIRRRLGDLEGLQAAARRLIQHFPESRHVPSAYLALASAQVQSGKVSAAQKTLGDLDQLVSSKPLPKRWRLECRLAQIRADDQKAGDEKRDALVTIVAEAGDDYPTVRTRAQVVEGETYLAEAEATQDRAKAKDLRASAKAVFEGIVSDPGADHETLAGAYTGLGDVYFYEGADAKDPEKLNKAVVSYLRVVVSFEDESRYVPKALFHAMRSFQFLDDRPRMRDMKRTLEQLYPSSPWTEEAQKFK